MGSHSPHSAWCPGGRTTANAPRTSPLITRSTACHQPKLMSLLTRIQVLLEHCLYFPAHQIAHARVRMAQLTMNQLLQPFSPSSNTVWLCCICVRLFVACADRHTGMMDELLGDTGVRGASTEGALNLNGGSGSCAGGVGGASRMVNVPNGGAGLRVIAAVHRLYVRRRVRQQQLVICGLHSGYLLSVQVHSLQSEIPHRQLVEYISPIID